MAKSVQEFIPIEEIRDGVIIIKGGQLRSILLASSINFDLKSADEQTAILQQYQAFLNSLDFQVQFFIQSRKLNIRPYLAILEARYKDQTNDLIKIQTREYIEFIKSVTEQTNVMTKSFFIIIPFAPAVFGSKKGGGILSSLFPSKKGSSQAAQDEMEKFEENRSQMEQRKSIVVQGLARIGIRTVSLGTEELVELFYKIFNPGYSKVPALQK